MCLTNDQVNISMQLCKLLEYLQCALLCSINYIIHYYMALFLIQHNLYQKRIIVYLTDYAVYDIRSKAS